MTSLNMYEITNKHLKLNNIRIVPTIFNKIN